MTPTLYINRNNEIKIKLLQDKQVVAENIVTSATLVIPDAKKGGGDIVFDTDGSNMELIDNSTKVTVNLKNVSDIEEGFYSSYLTIYDFTNVEGIAWDVINLHIQKWPTGD